MRVVDAIATLVAVAVHLAQASELRGQCRLDWTQGAPWGMEESTGLHLAAFDDGTDPAIYVGGRFPALDGLPVNRIARWDGTAWSAVGDGFEYPVAGLAVLDDGTGPALYAGNFAGTARWDGKSWTRLGSHTGVAVDFAVFDDGGGPAIYGGVAREPNKEGSIIVRWNGSEWTVPGDGLGHPSPLGACCVNALEVFEADGRPALYAGGLFSVSGDVPVSNVARWDGRSWESVGGGVQGVLVLDMVVHDDGSGPALYVGGDFTSAGGVPVRKVARWNGSAWSSVGVGLEGGVGSNPTVNRLAVFDDGSGPKLHAAGNFFKEGSYWNIARWDGEEWQGLGQGLGGRPGYVDALAVLVSPQGSALFAAGTFSVSGESVVKSIARLARVGGPSVDSMTPGRRFCAGQDVVLQVSASGEEPLDYQWLKDGEEIPGATEASFTIANAAQAAEGAYAVRITDACGSIESAPALLRAGTCFHRGEANGDGSADISDPVVILEHLFLGGEAPSCLESADADNSGELDLSDPVWLLNYLFLAGGPPAPPGPPNQPCGADPDEPGSAGDLGCSSYERC